MTSSALTTSRRSVLRGAGLLLLPAGLGGMAAAPQRDWTALAASVRADMAFAWKNYVEHAFGHDQIKPVSGGHEEFLLPKGPGLGLSIVEALDTLWLMGLDAELEQGVEWIKANLRFDIDGEIQVFETSIRMVGGLLSGYFATGDNKLLELAHDLGERLTPAFTKSPTGIPYRFVNLKTGAVRDPETFPAELGTYVPEFGILSQQAGDGRFYQLAKNAMRAAYDRRSKIDLIADTIHAETGKWLSRRATIGPPSDSYYESLWDGWQLLGDQEMKAWYKVHTKAILAHQAERVDGRLWFKQVDFETGQVIDRHQSELASFYAGLLGQGGDMADARAYLESWAGVQDRYGVLPEGYDFGTGKPDRVTNDLRPELADSAFSLWLVERDPRFREIGAVHYEQMRAASRAPYGFTVLTDVTASPKAQGDACPGYWWSEQMKYYWLLFSDTKRFDYDDNYLSTEGNVLRGLVRPE
jgi:mannosyl-oligosaccharide alpha-1,2-mannosidase